jgi:hypothetical protein
MRGAFERAVRLQRPTQLERAVRLNAEAQIAQNVGASSFEA